MTPDRIEGAILSASQAAALARLRYAVESRAGITLVCGPAGTGTSLVLGRLAAGIGGRDGGREVVGPSAAADLALRTPQPGSVVLADDAHACPVELLSAFAAASEIAAVVLAGHGRLLTLVSREPRLASRVRLRAVVAPFGIEDSRRSIAERFRAAGRAMPSDAVVRLAHDISGGIASRLLRLTDLVVATTAGRPAIGVEDVEALHSRLDVDAA